eukprot:11896456-Heterocapsa_arctica.AAC.1
MHSGDGAIGGTFDGSHAPHSRQECPGCPSAGVDHGGGNLGEAAEIGRGWLGRICRIERARPNVSVKPDSSEAGGCPHGKGGLSSSFHGPEGLFPARKTGSVSRSLVPGARSQGLDPAVRADVQRGTEVPADTQNGSGSKGRIAMAELPEVKM